MIVDRDAARSLALLERSEALTRMRRDGLLDAPGLDAVLEIARALMKDDPAVGERLAELVRDTSALAGSPVALPRATYLLAQARAASGEMAEALVLIDAARAGFDTLGRTTEALRTNLGQSQALNEMGRHDAALAACAEILRNIANLPLSDPEVAALMAAAHQNSGLAMELSGQFEEALDHYTSAHIGYESLGDTRAVAEVTYDRALVLLSLGQHAEALTTLQRSAEAFRTGGFRALQVMALANTAEVQLHRGEYQQCLASLAQASVALEGISSPGGEQTRLMVAGRAYLALNLLPEALASFGQAVALLAGTDLVIDRARAQWGQGLALARTGRIAAATEALAAAADQYRRSGQSSWLAEVLVDQARLQRADGDGAAAMSLAAEALEAAVDGTPAAASAQLLLAELGSAGDLGRLEQAAVAVQELGLAPLVASAAHAHGRGLMQAGRYEEARRELQRAVDAVESLRGNLAHELVLTRFLDDKLSPYEDLLAVSIALDAPAAETLAIAEQAKSRTLSDVVSGLIARGVGSDADPDDGLRALYGELFSGDGAADPERVIRLRERVRDLESRRELVRLRAMPVGDAAPLRPSTPASLRTSDGELAVSYAKTGDALHAFVLARGDVTIVADIASVQAVTTLTERLRRQWERFRLGPELVERHLPQMLASTTAVLAALYQALVAPIDHLLAGPALQRLVIVPDAVTNEVPFHALWDGKRSMLERFEITTSPSLGTLQHLPQRRAGTTLVIGVADELAPSVVDEVSAIVAILPAAMSLVGEQGTWSNIEPLLANAAHIHLAGHAMFRPDNPMYSALRLHDRWLTAADILGLDLRGATVVLSACDTARTTLAGSVEVNGFVRGFLGAGARTVVASQWTADDRASTDFMAELYVQLADHDPASAVRLAQLAAAARWPHPYYWAPWVVVGRSDLTSPE